jgi:hypothetical protein
MVEEDDDELSTGGESRIRLEEKTTKQSKGKQTRGRKEV